MKRIIAMMMIMVLLLGCIGIPVFAETEEVGEPAASKIGGEWLAKLGDLAEDAALQVELWFADLDTAAKRESLAKLLSESASEFLRNSPVVDDLSELSKDLIHSISEYNQYSDLFRASRSRLYEAYNNSRFKELVSKYAIDAEMLYASLFSPSIQVRITKEDLLRILSDENILSISFMLDSPATGDEPATDEPDHRFEEAYQDFVNGLETDAAEYLELYYHDSETGEVDWALVFFVCLPQSDEPVNMLVADRVVYAGGYARLFPFGYGIYDAARGTFTTVYALRDNLDEYPGLYEALWLLQIGRPIGDADDDGLLTILDATRIQRVLAELAELDDEKDACTVHDDSGDTAVRFSDADSDGKLTILDATRIQRRLAGLG